MVLDNGWLEREQSLLLHLPEEERVQRAALLAEIATTVEAYQEHIKAYNCLEYRKTLQNKGIDFVSVGKSSIQKMVWTKLFAMSLNREERKAIGYESCRWKIFLASGLPVKMGERARRAFDEVAKTKVSVFYQTKEEGFVVEAAELLCARDLDLEEDVFVFDDVNCWTYVYTHTGESYFYYRKEEPYDDGVQLELEI